MPNGGQGELMSRVSVREDAGVRQNASTPEMVSPAAPARPRPAAPRPRPDRPGVRPAAGRRGARPRRAHVGRAPQPPVPARLRRVAVQLRDDAAHRAGDGPAAARRPQRHRGLLRGRLLVARHVQHPLHRARRRVAERVPAEARGQATKGMPSCVAKQVDETGQESRSAGRRAVSRVTAMDITIHSSFLPHADPEASLAFYRDTLGFEVRIDVGYEAMRWITVGPPGQPGTSIVLHPPAADPGITDDERRTIAEMMAKGTYAHHPAPPPTSTPPSSACRRATPTSCRSRSRSPTASATAPSATRRAT